MSHSILEILLTLENTTAHPSPRPALHPLSEMSSKQKLTGVYRMGAAGTAEEWKEGSLLEQAEYPGRE